MKDLRVGQLFNITPCISHCVSHVKGGNQDSKPLTIVWSNTETCMEQIKRTVRWFPLLKFMFYTGYMECIMNVWYSITCVIIIYNSITSRRHVWNK